MSEKSIAERSVETLKWIQREQKANGLGMVEFDKVPDQSAVRFLLRKGDIFEPQQGMIKSVTELESEDEAVDAVYDSSPWVWRTPKPKKKGDVPEPYQFLPYPDWSVLPSAVAEALRGMGFSGAPFLYEGYSYRKMAGGALRRKMIGAHSKETLLAELKLIGHTNEALAELEQKIQTTIDDCRGKSKEITEVSISADIVYHLKDNSFSLKTLKNRL